MRDSSELIVQINQTGGTGVEAHHQKASWAERKREKGRRSEGTKVQHHVTKITSMGRYSLSRTLSVCVYRQRERHTQKN